ncbi:hypothetical protein ACHWQZ_G004953 [Mnemiopsis leidyi]
MTTALVGKDLGFTVHPRKSSRHPAVKVTDVDFADDLALTTDTAAEAQDLLHSVEFAANSIGLHLNESKTKYIGVNLSDDDSTIIKAVSGEELEKVDDFVYLGSRIMRTERDFEVRKGKAWGACHQLQDIWKLGMRRDMKIRLFRATVESVLLYGSETWTIGHSLEKRINGCYSRMLRMALNISWKERIRNVDVFGNITMPSVMIANRRMRMAGHIARHEDLLANKLLFWEPQHGHRGRGRPHLNYIDMLKRDTSLSSTDEIRTMMLDRDKFFSDLYNHQCCKDHPSSIDNDDRSQNSREHDLLHALNKDFTLEELTVTIKKLQNKKSVAEDLICNEMLTNSNKHLLELLQKLFNACLHQGAIDVTIGTEQGHTMSPELFKIFIHELSVNVATIDDLNAPPLNGLKVSHLLWADDLVLLALDAKSLQLLLDRLNEYAETWELSVNISKTNVMVINFSSWLLQCANGFKLGNLDIEPVRNYCYLGIQFSLNGSFKQATDELRKKALRSYFSIRRIIDTSALKLTDSLVKPVATHGCPV